MLVRAVRTKALLVQCSDLLKGKIPFIYYEGEPCCSSMLLRLLHYLINNKENEYDEDMIADWVSRNCLALQDVEDTFRPIDPSSEKMKKFLSHGRDLFNRMGKICL